MLRPAQPAKSKRLKKLKNELIDFNRGYLSQRLMIVMSGMLLLLMVSAAISLSMIWLSLSWQQSLSERFTVVVTVDNNDDVDLLRSQLEQKLDAIDGIEEYNIPQYEDLAKLLAPWLGKEASQTGFFLPILVSVRPKLKSNLSADLLESFLANIHNNIRVDDHGPWRLSFIRFADSLKWAGIIGFFIILVAVQSLVAVLVRSLFEANRDSLHLLHIMGAGDGFLVGLFSSYIRKLSSSACVIALIIFITMLVLIRIFDLNFIFPGNNTGLLFWLAISAPFIAIIMPIFASSVASISIFNAIRRWP